MKNLVRRLPVARVGPDVTVTSAFPFPISPQSSLASEQFMIKKQNQPRVSCIPALQLPGDRWADKGDPTSAPCSPRAHDCALRARCEHPTPG